ncbi:MAG: macro domain-containing protein [Methylococcales bacterium]|nr:macro domain-containing protein [Methylococcales bacterium]
MIHLVEGDILHSKAHAIAQGVGINDPMDKGLALQLHNAYPSMHKDFHHWCHQHSPEAGEAWMWSGARMHIPWESNNFWKGTGSTVHIVNLITQEGADSHDHRHGKATLSNVQHSLKALAKIAVKENFTSLALPRLGTGTGGLDWADVLPLIEKKLGDLNIPVYVYQTYHADQAANEA